MEDETRATEENIEKDSVEEGPRMRQLRQSLSMTVAKIISSVKYSLFRDNFKPIHNKYPECLTKLQSQMTTQLQQSMSEEIEDMFKEENIVPLMNDLDNLVEKYPSNEETAWRPSCDPDIDIVAHTLPERQRQRHYLQEIVKELESQNKILRQKYEKRKAGLLEITDEIKRQNTAIGNEISEGRTKMHRDEMQRFINSMDNIDYD